MAQAKTWVGLDVHAAKVVAAVVDGESGELRIQRLSGRTTSVVSFCAALSAPVEVSYEAGPTGFGLARALEQAGNQLENPLTGERFVFRRTASDTGGELLELDDYWLRPDHGVAEHVHPEMEERWEVIVGTVTFRIGGVERTASPGESVVAPPGTPHQGWNAGGTVAQLRIQMRPALRWEEVVEPLCVLAQEGRTDESGTPDCAASSQASRRCGCRQRRSTSRSLSSRAERCGAS